MKRMAGALISILTLAGCCYEIDCAQDNLNFGLVSFSATERDTIVFRRYQKSSNFQSLKDTMQITDINVLGPYVSGDTVTLMASPYPSTNIKFQLLADYDYEIFIPGANKTTSITEILEQKTTQRNCDVSDGNKMCFNPIISYKIDGQLKREEPFYIQK